MDLQQQLTRRRVVSVGATAVAGAVGLTALAACGSDDDAAGAADTTAAPSASASGTSEESGGSELAKLADVPVGGAVAAKGADGKPIIIAQPESGSVVAFSAVCTHQACTVAPSGDILKCPCHGSAFKPADGSVINGPAAQPLKAVSVSVSGDSVVAG